MENTILILTKFEAQHGLFLYKKDTQIHILSYFNSISKAKNHISYIIKALLLLEKF